MVISSNSVTRSRVSLMSNQCNKEEVLVLLLGRRIWCHMISSSTSRCYQTVAGHVYSVRCKLWVTMLVFYKNWQGIGESPVKNEFHRESSADWWNRHSWRRIRRYPVSFCKTLTFAYPQNPKTVVAMDINLGYDRWKHQYLWHENVDVMTSQCLQNIHKGICEYPANFTAHWLIKLCVTNRVH